MAAEEIRQLREALETAHHDGSTLRTELDAIRRSIDASRADPIELRAALDAARGDAAELRAELATHQGRVARAPQRAGEARRTPACSSAAAVVADLQGRGVL